MMISDDYLLLFEQTAKDLWRKFVKASPGVLCPWLTF